MLQDGQFWILVNFSDKIMLKDFHLNFISNMFISKKENMPNGTIEPHNQGCRCLLPPGDSRRGLRVGRPRPVGRGGRCRRRRRFRGPAGRRQPARRRLGRVRRRRGCAVPSVAGLAAGAAGGPLRGRGLAAGAGHGVVRSRQSIRLACVWSTVQLH